MLILNRISNPNEFTYNAGLSSLISIFSFYYCRVLLLKLPFLRQGKSFFRKKETIRSDYISHTNLYKKTTTEFSMQTCCCNKNASTEINYQSRELFYSIFLSRTLIIRKKIRQVKRLSLFLPIPSTLSQKFRHFCAVIYLRFLPRIFNRNVCNYQTAV